MPAVRGAHAMLPSPPGRENLKHLQVQRRCWSDQASWGSKGGASSNGWSVVLRLSRPRCRSAENHANRAASQAIQTGRRRCRQAVAEQSQSWRLVEPMSYGCSAAGLGIMFTPLPLSATTAHQSLTPTGKPPRGRPSPLHDGVARATHGSVQAHWPSFGPLLGHHKRLRHPEGGVQRCHV